MFVLIVSWFFAAAALIASSKVFNGFELRGDFGTALWVAACYSVLSFFLGWLIFGIIGVATLGLGFVFHLVTELVAAAIVLRLVSALSSQLNIRGFVPALGGAVFLALAGQVAWAVLN
jgi:uncharacterized membrane protein YvlD (DUF360 family)